MRGKTATLESRAGIAASNRQARCCSVSFVQRFGEALNLNVHFHTMALDGIYLVDEDGAVDFRNAAPPSDAEVARVTSGIRRRASRLLERRGLGPHGGLEATDPLQHDQPVLAELYGASISWRVATGPRAGRRIAEVGDMIDVDGQALPAGPRCASIAGFSVHSNVCVPAHDRLPAPELFMVAADEKNLLGGRFRMPLLRRVHENSLRDPSARSSSAWASLRGFPRLCRHFRSRKTRTHAGLWFFR